ncbi:uncharacterized protein LOC105797119 [Gossypium raimondii]|uniref:uncharacterized protein LOC105797119 n=1 Tax=Gossypium raimondii TaxID=29730 RepID=UPI00227D29C6|nr:uncharacterized protein LOC105797119 [Gossypium raimondii]
MAGISSLFFSFLSLLSFFLSLFLSPLFLFYFDDPKVEGTTAVLVFGSSPHLVVDDSKVAAEKGGHALGVPGVASGARLTADWWRSCHAQKDQNAKGAKFLGKNVILRKYGAKM